MSISTVIAAWSNTISVAVLRDCFRLERLAKARLATEAEAQTIIAETVRTAAGRTPVFVGIGGNATDKVIENIKRWDRFDFDGIVSVCPYYSRPSQDGLIAHFTAISEATGPPRS